ncbi:MAG: type I methionyl aminopeptidase [Candidatus Yanofskybacteria bacterium]|nr:type I methionyl aminopeptidase [Candidatus Yanofskybacteria bacterium]
MIHLKSTQEIEIMREGGRILAEILKKLSEAVKPGITTKNLDKLARELVLFYKVKPAFLDYGGYPAAVCTSVNNEVVHCVPSERELKEGETISLDMGVVYKGFNLDAAVTVPVTGGGDYEKWSKSNSQLYKLIEVTKEALNAGIKQAKAGNHIGKIGHAVQTVVEKNGFNVIRDLVGHGIGRELHEEPQVPNYGPAEAGPKLEAGMVIAIEPMVVVGNWRLVKGKDGFSYNTADGSAAAHFEHTVAITEDGPQILTAP